MTLSIVIPCYNDAFYIDSCFRAILNQSEKPDEIVCIDNNSTDDTLLKLGQYKPEFVQQGTNFIIAKESRQGIRYARQTGYEIAGGQIFGSIDLDTIINTDWVKTVKASFGANQNLGCVSGEVYFRDQNKFLNLFIKWNFWMYGKSRSMFQFWGCNGAFRSDLYWQVGGLTGAILMYDQLGLVYDHEDVYLYEQFKKTGWELKVEPKMAAGAVGNTGWIRKFEQIRTFIPIRLWLARHRGYVI